MYFIYSEDNFLLNKTTNKVIKGLQNEKAYEIENYSLINDDLNEIYTSLTNISLFEEPKIIIIADAWFATEEKIKLHKSFDESIIYKICESDTNNIVIFTLNAEKLSKRLKITKFLEEKLNVTNVKKMDEQQVTNYIVAYLNKNEKTISNENATLIYKSLPNDMQALTNELSKLCSTENKEITIKVIEENLTKYVENDIFKLSESFIDNDINQFLKLYKDYLLLNDDITGLIGLLNSNLVFFRDVNLLRKIGNSTEEIVSITKAHPFRVKLALKNRLKISQLNGKIKLLYEIQKGIFSSKMDKENIVEYLFIKNMEESNGN